MTNPIQPPPLRMLSQTRIGRYAIVSQLGHGARGTLYKAVDTPAGREVAIRTIEFDAAGGVRAAFDASPYGKLPVGRLVQANIAAILDAGVTADCVYIVSEYLEARSLREALDSGLAPTAEEAARIACAVAEALHHGHENGVLHGDLRPENVMLAPGGGVKLRDFGIARIAAGLPAQIGMLPEAPHHYLAPEQVAGGHADGRADLFALGVVLYELLTGVTPFAGEDPAARVEAVLKAAPAAPGTLNPRVPPALDRIVSRALAKRPRERYPTALAFARDLRELAVPPGKASCLVTAAMQTGGASPLAEASSRPRKAALLHGATFVLAVSILAAWLLHVPPRGDDLAPPDRPLARADLPLGPPSPAAAAPPPIALPPAEPAGQAVTARPATPRHPEARSAPRVMEAVPPPVAPAQATLALAISPWGEVHVDGDRVGVSPPLAALTIQPGMHEVEIRNQAFAPYRETVTLKPGASLKIRHKFE